MDNDHTIPELPGETAGDYGTRLAWSIVRHTDDAPWTALRIILDDMCNGTATDGVIDALCDAMMRAHTLSREDVADAIAKRLAAAPNGPFGEYP